MSPLTTVSNVFSRCEELSVQSPTMEMVKYSSAGVGSGVASGGSGVAAGEFAGLVYSGAGRLASGRAEHPARERAAAAQQANAKSLLIKLRVSMR